MYKDLNDSLPLILTDENGTIIHMNAAAQKKCAAASIGQNITAYMDKSGIDEYNRARSSGAPSAMLPVSLGSCKCALFSFTSIDEIGLCRIYPLSGNILHIKKDNISYSEISKCINEICCESGITPANSRQLTSLYEKLLNINIIPPQFREKILYPLIPSITCFRDLVLPCFRRFNCPLTLEYDKSVTETSLIYTEINSFHLLLCAILAACGHHADDKTVMRIYDSRDRIIITTSCRTEQHLPLVHRTTSLLSFSDIFGYAAADIMFAEYLCRMTGHILALEIVPDTSGCRIIFTLEIVGDDYYPTGLKSKPELYYKINESFMQAYSIYTKSTEE